MKYALLLVVMLSGCASNLTPEQREQRKYEADDRYLQRLEKYYRLERSCKEGIWIKSPSSQYQRTGVPTKWDLNSTTCGPPAFL